MPRTCTICTHQERQAIDEALVTGESFRHIAARFDTSTGALQRHKAHLMAHVARAHEAAEVARADSLLDQLKDLQAKTLTILQKAESVGDLRTATAAIGQARQNLELLGKMAGELGPDTQVNILVTSPAWVSLWTRIVRVLNGFPEAKEAVISALTEGDHAIWPTYSRPYDCPQNTRVPGVLGPSVPSPGLGRISSPGLGA